MNHLILKGEKVARNLAFISVRYLGMQNVLNKSLNPVFNMYSNNAYLYQLIRNVNIPDNNVTPNVPLC